MNFAIAPPGILTSEPDDQCFQFSSNTGSPSRPPALERPFPADQCSVPLQHGIRLNYHNGLSEPQPCVGGQAGKFGRKHRKREFLAAGNAGWRGPFPLKNAELVSKQEELEIFLAIRQTDRGEQIKQEGQDLGKYKAYHRITVRCTLHAEQHRCLRAPQGVEEALKRWQSAFHRKAVHITRSQGSR